MTPRVIALILLFSCPTITLCDVFTNPFSLREVFLTEAAGVGNLLTIYNPESQQLKEMIDV